jgi:hypothetical protein
LGVHHILICINQTISRLMHIWSIFCSQMSHKHIQIHKIHHFLDLGETTTIPLKVVFVTHHEGYIKIAFSWDFLVGSWTICEIGTPTIFDKYNFLCNFYWSDVTNKVIALVESFPTICGMPTTLT